MKQIVIDKIGQSVFICIFLYITIQVKNVYYSRQVF